jgi:hypothetical protein
VSFREGQNVNSQKEKVELDPCPGYVWGSSLAGIRRALLRWIFVARFCTIYLGAVMQRGYFLRSGSWSRLCSYRAQFGNGRIFLIMCLFFARVL